MEVLCLWNHPDILIIRTSQVEHRRTNVNYDNNTDVIKDAIRSLISDIASLRFLHNWCNAGDGEF